MFSKKNAAILCIALFCLVFQPFFANAADEKPKVHINTASSLGFLGSTNYGTTKFAEIVRNVGFTIDHGVHPDLTSGSPLDGIDVYLLFDPNFPFLDSDKIALRQWVRDGGILITGDYLSPAKMSRFLEEFGVGLTPWEVEVRDLILPSGSPLSGPLNVTTGYTKFGLGAELLDATRSEVILRYDDGTIAMTRTISHAGKGEIIAIPALSILFDNNVNGDIGYKDNVKIIENLFRYIKAKIAGTTGDSGYDLNLLKAKFKKGTTFLPGDDIKFIARIRNIGTEKSDETRVVFFIDRLGASPSMRMEIDSSTVPEINAKKKTKIIKKAFLPEDLEPGTYELIAVIDPDGLTDDADIMNNVATAKKTFIVQ